MATLKSTISETLTISGKQIGESHTKSITGINDYYKRTLTVPAMTETALYTTHTSAVSGSTLDRDNIKYARVTNLSSSTYVDLLVQNSDNDEVAYRLGPQQTLVLWDHGSTILDANAGALTVVAGVQAVGQLLCADGDDTGNQPSENDYIEIISTNQVTKRYVFIDAQLSTITTGTVLATGNDSGSGTVTSANNGGIAVAAKMTTSPVAQHAWLTEMATAINHANGHNGAITAGTVSGTGDGAQTLNLTQLYAGTAGNTTITESITHAAYTVGNFSAGGLADGVDGETSASKVFISSINAISKDVPTQVQVFVAST